MSFRMAFWVTLSDLAKGGGSLAKYSMTWSVARSLCDSWASCWKSFTALFLPQVQHVCSRSKPLHFRCWKQDILVSNTKYVQILICCKQPVLSTVVNNHRARRRRFCGASLTISRFTFTTEALLNPTNCLALATIVLDPSLPYSIAHECKDNTRWSKKNEFRGLNRRTLSGWRRRIIAVYGSHK